jgi:adenylate cyclase
VTLRGVERSEEIRQVVIRFIESLRDGDEEALRNRVSRQPGFLRFGTDPAEHWDDGESAVRVWVQQMRELDGYPWQVTDDVHAMHEGSVGWAGVRTAFETADGPVEYWFTCVLHLEHGEWKLVQWQSGVPVANEEHGFFLTKSVDDIAESVSEARPDLTSSSSPDGTVTIAFTDIEESTRLNAIMGDRRWMEVVHAHNEVIAEVTAEHGGTVVKNQGDGFMLAFESSRRAAACAPVLQRSIGERFNDPGSVIRVRIGVPVGEVVHAAEDFFGHAVNHAARVASAAAGGEILVSGLVHDLLIQTGDFSFDESREVELKGFEVAQVVYPLALSE